MTQEWASAHDTVRYRALGLIANPFAINADHGEPPGIEAEVAAAGNRLLKAIDQAADEDTPRPIWVSKSADVPNYYSLRAESETEATLANDDSLDLVYGYIQLYLLRVGRIRATLNTLGERIAFRDWPTTLALFVEKVLQEPDEDLISYQVLGEDGLEVFKREFEADRASTIATVFGEPEIERHPELEELGDRRLAVLEPDVNEEDEPPEVDQDLGSAPGVDQVLSSEVKEQEPRVPAEEVLDYIVEYTKIHLSPVVARALRVYKARGLAAMSLEFRITKAPRKTLAALVQLARVRFRRVVIIYDGFENWMAAPADVRSKTVGSLAEIRWLLEADACIVMMLERGQVPELEEQYSAATRIDWDFEGLLELEERPNEIGTQLVNGWLSAAALSGATPMTLDDSVLSALSQAAAGDLRRFIYLAHAAIEDAAERGVTMLDEQARVTALDAEIPEAVL